MNSRDRFRAACRSEKVDCTPIWLMRQAGRSLPEYRALRKKYSFLDLVRTPDLAAEVTLQPVRRFGMDAAILFSDILVIPEALGQPYSFDENGLKMKYLIRSEKDIEKLDQTNVAERLSYVRDALILLRRELPETALLGFGGSPWTLGHFMVEGGMAERTGLLKEWFYNNRKLFDKLMRIISDALIAHFRLQISTGIDGLQIFDSLGGTLAANVYEEASLRWIRRTIKGMKSKVPVILFAKGVSQWDLLSTSGADVLSVDWTIPMRTIPTKLALQGNFDPALLSTNPKVVRREANRLLDEMHGRKGHIFNLGHGVRADSKVENIKALVDTVHEY